VTPGLRLTDRDAQLLEFAAEHRLVLAAHAQALLGTSHDAAERRLRMLAGAGLLVRRARFQGQPGCFHITKRGLAATGSELPVPREDLRCYAHDVGVAWLWLAAARDALGPTGAIVGERRMRSLDGAAEPGAEPHGVRLGGLGPGGLERRHYPDLLLVRPDGSRVAIELELSAKGRVRREGILAAYGADPRIRSVLYLTDRPAVARAISSSAAGLGLASIVHVQRLSWGGPRPGLAQEARALARTRERERAVAR